MFVAKFAKAPPAVTVLLSPNRLVAKLKIDPELVVALEFVPTTKAAPNNPSAWACAPSPMAREPLNNVLVQSGLPPRPKIDAQVAFAVGANPNPALANNPLAAAPATRAPAILRGEFTMLSAIIFCSNHVKNASIPLVARPRYYVTFPPWSGYQPGGGNGAVMVFPTWSVASDTSGAAQLAAPFLKRASCSRYHPLPPSDQDVLCRAGRMVGVPASRWHGDVDFAHVRGLDHI